MENMSESQFPQRFQEAKCIFLLSVLQNFKTTKFEIVSNCNFYYIIKKIAGVCVAHFSTEEFEQFSVGISSSVF